MLPRPYPYSYNLTRCDPSILSERHPSAAFVAPRSSGYTDGRPAAIFRNAMLIGMLLLEMTKRAEPTTPEKHSGFARLWVSLSHMIGAGQASAPRFASATVPV